MMKGGVSGSVKGCLMETDPGTRPAAPASPAPQSANKMEPTGFPSATAREFHYGAMVETAARTHPFPGLEDLDDDGAGEIAAEFRRRLRCLRYLRRGERAQALQAAREWRFLAIKALKTKREQERRARITGWRLGLPPPRQPN
jgi:hypothetical protein